jgi:hypothetical protein
VILIYLLTLNFVAMQVYTPWVFARLAAELPIYHSAQRPGPLFLLFGLFLIAVPLLSCYNLYRCWRQAHSPSLRRQLATLLSATLLAVFGAVYAAFSIWLGLKTPVLATHLSLGAGVALLGYGVARYNALVEGRAIGLDFIYTALAAGLVVGAYLLAAFVSGLIFDVPFLAFTFIIMLSVASHSIYDWARSYLDWLFYRRQYRELRANLRDFARTTTPDHDIRHRLRVILQTLCQSLKASKGFIALRDGEGFDVLAGWQIDAGEWSMAQDALAEDEIVALDPSVETDGLNGMALLVPLHACGEQTGAIVLGHRVDGVSYNGDDCDLLEDLADTVASMVHTVRLQERSVGQIDALLREVQERERLLQERMQEALIAEARSPLLEVQGEREAISLIEDALRHVHDYSYLGEHDLARLCMVDVHLAAQEENAFLTHLDRGKALHHVLRTAVDKLKPSGPRPSLPTREWHQYVILHDCYVLGELTRNVMGALYIGEGTFNRARRQAVRGVTRALGEMERQARWRLRR